MRQKRFKPVVMRSNNGEGDDKMNNIETNIS
jgi:hypothetical protein